MKSTRILNFFVILCFFIGMIGSNKPFVTSVSADSLSDILQRGYITVGADVPYEPFEFINQSTGLFEGFDVMIAHQIAIDLGVGLQFKSVLWDNIIPNLQANQYDIIISAMTITVAREIEVDFSRWYYKIEKGALVPIGNPLNINSEADLNQSLLTIGVRGGSASDWYTQTQNLTATINTYSDENSAIADLKLGVLDVVLADRPILEYDAQQSGLTEVPFGFLEDKFGIAVRNGESTLLTRINQTLEDLLGTNPNNPEPSSLYNAIHHYWFGVSFLPYYKGSVTSRIIPVAPFYDESGLLVPRTTNTITTTVSTTITSLIPTTEIQTNTKTETTTEISEQILTTTKMSAFYFLIPFMSIAFLWKIKRKQK